MGVFTLFGDASGKWDTTVLTVAGNLAEVRRWRELRDGWRRVLDEFGVPYLHMRKLVGFQGPYAKWKDAPDDAPRRAFLSALIRIAHRKLRKSFSRTILLSEYRDVNTRWMLKEEFGPPFTIAGLFTVQLAEQWRKDYHIQAPIKYIFEDGDDGQGALREAARKHFGVSVDFEPKAEHIEFQVADLAAYENLKANTDWIIKDKETLSPSLKFRGSGGSLFATVPNDWGMIRTLGLESFCAYLGLSKRATGVSNSKVVNLR